MKTNTRFLNRYVLVVTSDGQLFSGFLEYQKRKTVELYLARRISNWGGNSSVFQLAEIGLTKTDSFSFSMEVEYLILNRVTKILLVSELAKDSLTAVNE